MEPHHERQSRAEVRHTAGCPKCLISAIQGLGAGDSGRGARQQLQAIRPVAAVPRAGCGHISGPPVGRTDAAGVGHTVAGKLLQRHARQVRPVRDEETLWRIAAARGDVCRHEGGGQAAAPRTGRQCGCEQDLFITVFDRKHTGGTG